MKLPRPAFLVLAVLAFLPFLAAWADALPTPSLAPGSGDGEPVAAADRKSYSYGYNSGYGSGYGSGYYRPRPTYPVYCRKQPCETHDSEPTLTAQDIYLIAFIPTGGVLITFLILYYCKARKMCCFKPKAVKAKADEPSSKGYGTLVDEPEACIDTK
jgi:hypothetical protein